MPWNKYFDAVNAEFPPIQINWDKCYKSVAYTRSVLKKCSTRARALRDRYLAEPKGSRMKRALRAFWLSADHDCDSLATVLGWGVRGVP
jgi:hypothetical protein